MDTSGKLCDPLAPENVSPRNTGLEVLAPAQPALICYPYDNSERFPEPGQGGRDALVAGVYIRNPVIWRHSRACRAARPGNYRRWQQWQVG